MNKTLNILLLIICLNLLWACQMHFWNNNQESDGDIVVSIERYDRLQSRFLTNADFSALQNMNTNYPIETRTLIENVLQLGTVDQADINEKYLKFYQDTTLQHIIREVDVQYASVNDLNEQLTKSFRQLKKMLPHLHVPEVYTQIGALGQSIIVGDSIVGISLDKYLGNNYSGYMRFYTDRQRETMTRENIVPDCLLFYLVSLYPLQDFDNSPQEVRDEHIGRIMHVVNTAMGKKFFNMSHAKKAEAFKRSNPKLSWDNYLSITK